LELKPEGRLGEISKKVDIISAHKKAASLEAAFLSSIQVLDPVIRRKRTEKY
jgi:hypothetical protein